MVCGVCGRQIQDEEVYACYPEDGSCICRDCFGAKTDDLPDEQSPCVP